MSELSSDKKKLGNLSFEFVKLLNDIEADNALEKIFTTASQTDKDFAVKHLEKDLWNPEIQKPLPINPTFDSISNYECDDELALGKD